MLRLLLGAVPTFRSIPGIWLGSSDCKIQIKDSQFDEIKALRGNNAIRY